MTDTLQARAMKFAIDVHGDQMYGAQPYSYHLGSVVTNVLIRKKDDPLLYTYVAVAWLHDVMEDCGVTFKQIEDEFGLCIATSVQAITKLDGMDYPQYILGCINNAIAREVKICDTMANLTESFKSTGSTNPAVKAKGAKGLAKYPLQLHMLIEGVLL